MTMINEITCFNQLAALIYNIYILYIYIGQFRVDVTVMSLAPAGALWWQKHMVTSGVEREKYNKR